MSKTSFDEELQSLQLDRPTAGKTAVQIQRHSIEPQYDNKPTERSLYILTKGDDLQKLSVIHSLPNLLKTDYNGAVQRIIPKIQQELPINSSAEFHLVTSKMFMTLIEMKLDLNLMRPVLQGIESKDPVVASAWNETLLGVIPSLSDSVIKTEVLPFAVKLSQLNRPVFYRVNSCKMLGKIAIHPKISAFDVKKDVVPVTQSLCQDCLYEVRAAMCIELPKVAKGLGNDINVKICLIPCLVELSNDENMQVRAAAVNAAVFLIPFLNAETIKQTAIPVIKRLCLQCGKEGDQTFPTVANIYGKLLTNLHHHLTDADSVWFLDHYKELSKRGLSIMHEDLDTDPALALTCREFCASNLPDVTFFVLTQIPQETNKWYGIFKELAGDPCYLVRKTVADSITDITKILGKDGKLILPDLLRLIRDDAEEVLDVLVPNIGSTLTLLASVGFLSREQTTQATLDIGRALLKCQTEIFKCYNWRRRKIFLQQLESLPLCMPPDFIHQHFTPLIMKLTIDARARPVRTQAARTLLLFLRFNLKENHRKWIRETLINSLCNSECCYSRHIFINMCVEAIEVFSWKYFKEHFFIPLLTLGDDPVSTVRMCVVNLCPTLKQMLIMPIDRNLQLKLENLVSKIEVMEKDKDVISALKLKLKEMRSMQVNKQEALLEEKRRIDEEDRIAQGKYMLPGLGSQRPATAAPPGAQKEPVRTRQIPSRSSLSTTTPPSSSISEMSFLDQHFYIDAGVALPESSSKTPIKTLEIELSRLTLEKNRPTDEIVPTVSVENTDIENMSDEDLIELKTSTTNITDDVKVTIEKKSGAIKSPSEGVKKRNKRNSCFFVSDIPKSGKTQLSKRRSLNLVGNETSRIPVFAAKNFPAKRNRVAIEQNKMSSKKSTIKTETDSENRINDNTMCNKNGNNENSLEDKIVKDVPKSKSNKDKTQTKSIKDNLTKASNLPVLIRRPTSSTPTSR